MMFAFDPRRLAVLCLVPVLLFACGRSETETTAPTPPVAATPPPFKVSGLVLGNAIDADKRVTSPTTTFATGDTIYATVVSDGASPSVTLSARFTFEDGQVVNETTQEIAPTGPATSEFHISNPDGWPVGKYKVEVTANGAPAGSADFEVR
jgi:hypothetical protein